MSKQNRATLVFNCVLTFIILLMMACNSNNHIVAGASGEAVFIADRTDNVCVVNMDRSYAESNRDFIWCHGIYDHYKVWRTNKVISRATYHPADDFCMVEFNHNEDEESAFHMWTECVFNRLEYKAKQK